MGFAGAGRADQRAFVGADEDEVGGAAPGAALAADGSDQIRFNRDIRPILSDNCFSCHGPDKNKRKGKLRLDYRNNAIEKGAIVREGIGLFS